MSQLPITLRDIAYSEMGLDYAVPPHSHTFEQWYCVVYGTVNTTIEGIVHTLKAEESILIPGGMERAPHCKDKAPSYIRAHFDNHRLNLGTLSQRPIAMPVDLRSDLHTLVAELRQPGPNTQELVEALIIRLLIGLARHASSEDAKMAPVSRLNATSHQDLILQVEAFMQRNLHRTLTHADLARTVNLSPTHLARIFVQSMGKTLTARLTEMRIDLAKTLLLESTLSITEVGAQVGYNSPSHFTKTFTTAVGISPSDYRRSNGHIWRTPLDKSR